MITNDDCTKCGACCAYFFDEPLRDVGHRGIGLFISNDEVSQIPESIRRSLVVEVPIGSSFDRWLRGRKVGDHYQCKALEDEIGNCKCGIYENRPMTCRTCEPGGEQCLKARAAFGFPNPEEASETEG
jgi:Fe-S-cluster containining protein